MENLVGTLELLVAEKNPANVTTALVDEIANGIVQRCRSAKASGYNASENKIDPENGIFEQSLPGDGQSVLRIFSLLQKWPWLMHQVFESNYPVAVCINSLVTGRTEAEAEAFYKEPLWS